MKKRVLSLFMALALCFTMLPTAAFAELAGAAAEEPQNGADVSGVYTAGDDTAAQDKEETDEAVQAAQALIDALPGEVTADGAEELQAQLIAIDEALVALDEAQLAALDMTRYEAICAALAGLTAVQAAHDDHPICGAAHTDIGDHTADKCANVTWTAWNGVDAIPYDSETKTAYVYLSGNAERTEILTVAAGYKLYLCLNGYSLTKTTSDSTTSFEGVITIYKGAQFTLCDCRGGGKITHAAGRLGKGVRCGDSGGSATFAMFGGEISGNHVDTSSAAQDGAGVEVHNGKFILYGGRIINNEVAVPQSNGGGGVCAHGGSFTMYGGEISGNTSAGDGGGVSAVGASFTMRGGSITNNTASAGDGGGAALYNDTFELSGGTITGNTAKNGGGVYYYHYGYEPLFVSGDVTITGNRNASGADNNVYLPSGVYMIVTGELKNVIGVTTESVPSASNAVMIAANGGYMTEAMKDHFVYDLAGDCKSVYDSTNRAIYLKVIPHEHPICGATHTDINGHTGECSNVKWTAWDGVSDITYDENNTAYVYLTTNAERDSTLEIAQGNTLYLCLNGHSITTNKSSSVVTVGNDATFSLCDCKDGGKLTHGMYTSTSRYSGHGVHLTGSKGTFNMYGGNITGNRASYGGGVTIDKEYSNATFNLYGGSITDNATTGGDGGGGVHALFGTFTMYGGSITDNHADRANFGGGGVYAGSRTGKFYMKGGSITGNTAKNGGGVYVYKSSEFYVSGSVDITGNKNTLGIDENVYLRSGAYFVVNADLNADAKIGVTAANDIASGKYVNVAYCSEKYSYTENTIFSDKPEYDTLRWGTDVRLYNGLPHVHPDCGDKTCTNTFHTNNNMWTPVSTEAELNAIAAKGSCYLTNNIELTSTYTPKDGVHLCLNGYSLIAKGNFDVITLPDGDSGNNLSLDVCDCNASGSGNGKITHADGKTGRGVYMGTGTNFDLYGGSITGNHVKGNGGGIYAKGVNFVDMSTGASITGNTATGNGGGVMLTGSSFNDGSGYGSAYFCTESSGGTISDNTAGGNGGGVYISGVGTGSSFAPRNVTVTGNKAAKGGGVYVSSTGRLSVRGATQITGNESTGGTADNVYLVDGKTIGFWSGLDDGAVIGVTAEKKLANGGYAVIADGNGNITTTLTETDLNAFTSDAGYGKLLKDNKIFFTTGALHEHAICGASCDHETTHGDELWQPLTYDAATMTLYCGGEAVKSYDYSILAGKDENGSDKHIYYMEYRLPAGNYYLAENIALNGGTADGTTYVGGMIRTKGYDVNVNLCLNGFTLSATNPNTPLLSVPGTQTLTLSDCQGGGKIQTDAGGYNVLQVFGDEGKGGTFTMYGGTLSGARTGVYTYNYGVVNLFGGTITGNECGLDIGPNGTVTVGGTVSITGNTKQNLYLYTGGKTTAIISIDATLTQASRIGVSSSLTADGQSPIQVATGAENDALNYTQIFTADAVKDGYVVVKDGTELHLKKHAHEWISTLSEDKATITITCSNEDGHCPNTNGGSVTLKAPAHTTYGDGKAANATFEETNWAFSANNTVDIRYWKGTISDDTYLGNGDENAPAGAGNYIATYGFGTVQAQISYTVAKAELTVTANDNTITYGDTPTTRGVTYDGFVNGEDENTKGVLYGSLNIYFSGYSQYDDVGVYEGVIKVGGLTAANYNVKTVPGTLTVTERPVTLTWAGYENRTYGDGKTVTATAGRLVNGDAVDVAVSGGDENIAGTHTATATGLTGTKAGNYKLPTTKLTQEYTIDLAKQTLTFKDSAGLQSLVYGDTLDNPAANKRADGGAVTYTSSNENVATVDENGVVTARGVGHTVINAKAEAVDGKYTEAMEGYTLAVTQRAVTVSGITAENKTYNGTTAATLNCTGATITGKVDGDELTVTATGAFTDKDAGENKTVSITDLTLGGASASNYRLESNGQQATASASISPAKLYFTKAEVAEKIYDGTAAATVTSVKFDGLITGDTLTEGTDYTVSCTPYMDIQGNVSAEAGNDKMLAVTVKLADSVKNYRFSGSDGKSILTLFYDLTIKQATPVIKVSQDTQSIMKNGVAVDISGWASFNNTDSGAKLTYTLDGAPTGITLEDNKLKAADDASTVSTFIIKVTADATANYTAPAEKTITVTVEDKLIPALEGSVTLSPAEITYGEPLRTITISGTMKDGDTLVKGTFQWQTPDIILETGAHDAAWTFTPDNESLYISVNGTSTVTVQRAALTGVSVRQDGVLTYTGAEQTAQVVTAATAVNGQNATFTYSAEENGTYSSTVPGVTGVGRYTVYYKAAADHHETATGSFTVTVVPAALTNVSVTAAELTYNGKVQTADVTAAADTVDGSPVRFTYSAEQNGTYSNTVPAFLSVGTHVVWYKAEAANHETAAGSMSITIGKAQLTVPEITLNVTNGHAATYSVDLRAALDAALPAGCQLGTVQYGGLNFSGDEAYYDVMTSDISRKGVLTLAINKVDSTAEGQVATVTVSVETGNYQELTVTVNLRAVNKIVPTGTPTLSKTTLAYGEKLGTIRLSGSMWDGNTAVKGTFTWSEPYFCPASGNYNAEWVFTPDNGGKYAAVSGTAAVTVQEPEQKTYTLGGTVLEYSINGSDPERPAVGATVTIRKGVELYGQPQQTDENGSFSIEHVLPGVYNVVVEHGDKIVTAKVQIIDKNETLTVKVPHEQINSELEIKDPTELTENTVVGGLDDEAGEQFPEDNGDASVSINMEIKEQPRNDLDSAQNAIRDMVKDKVLEFIDMTLTMVKNGEKSELKDTATVLEIIISYDTSRKNITVVRHHVAANGGVETIPLTESTTGADGTFYIDTANKCIHIFANKFSTYAIGYTQTSDGNPSTPDSGRVSPATGDAGLMTYAAMALTGCTGTALLLRRRKRED